MSEHKRKETVVVEHASNDPLNSWLIAEESSALWWRNRLSALVLMFIPTLVLYWGVIITSDSHGKLGGELLAGSGLLIVGILMVIIHWSPAQYLILQAAKGRKPTLLECYSMGFRLLPRTIGLTLMVTAFVALGVLCLIIPGIILFRRYFLAIYYLIDQNMGIRQAMAASARDSKPNASYIWWTMILAVLIFPLVSSLISLIYPPYGGIAGLFVGLLYLFGPALRYTDIQDRKQQIELKAGTTKAGKKPAARLRKASAQ